MRKIWKIPLGLTLLFWGCGSYFGNNFDLDLPQGTVVEEFALLDMAELVFMKIEVEDCGAFIQGNHFEKRKPAQVTEDLFIFSLALESSKTFNARSEGLYVKHIEGKSAHCVLDSLTGHLICEWTFPDMAGDFPN